ncbi:uncharacterized protein LOC124355887 [Homalodisca vitripennis]|uniref:uncharacterized protein LOC124355887 n=1 Tax=Homalodisca vitripennis TaxID=197043 RepID=UPI001EE9F105|nr:uncharacterized protein LOC124355887 [Homalodisca vitripennis]
MCNMISTFFCSMYAPAHNGSPPTKAYDTPFTFSEVSVTVEAIHKRLRALNASTGCGPDNITPRVLIHCHAESAPILLFLFNLSLAKGVFPEILKEGYVVPTFKSDYRQDVTNYRTIVILSVMGKILEDLVLDILQPLFKNIIIEEQHGFMAGRSTFSYAPLATVSKLTNYAAESPSMVGLIMKTARHGVSSDALVLYKSFALQLLE